jgi:hypothetical protein
MAYASRIRKKTNIEFHAIELAVNELLNAVERFLKEFDLNSKDGKKSQATVLVEMVVEEARELFHAAREGSEAFISVPVDGHHEIYPINSSGFRFWLAHQFYKRYHKTPGEQGVREAIQTLVALALHDGAEHQVYTRIAEHDGAIYIDMVDDRWRAIRIDQSGWEVVDDPPVMFVRRNGMLPLPEPTRGGSISDLRPFLNLPDDHNE